MKSLTKKIIMLGLVLLLAGSIVLAADVYPAYKGKPVTLSMWAWTSNENYSIDEFQKEYPNIKVKWENFGVHYDKVQTALAAGSGLPDVLMIEYFFAPQYMDLGAFQPINKWLNEKKFIDLFGKPALGWCAMMVRYTVRRKTAGQWLCFIGKMYLINMA